MAPAKKESKPAFIVGERRGQPPPPAPQSNPLTGTSGRRLFSAQQTGPCALESQMAASFPLSLFFRYSLSVHHAAAATSASGGGGGGAMRHWQGRSEMASESQWGRFKRLTPVRNSMAPSAEVTGNGSRSAGRMRRRSSLARRPPAR